jgi:hypothetical protein
MTYQISIDEEPAYLHVRVTGENSPGAVRGYLAEIYAACVERNVGTVLIEENLAGPGLSLLDIYQVVEEGSAHTWPHVRQIACVDVNVAHRPGNNHFAETVAVNRGVNVRSFFDLDAAKTWLQEETQR